MRGTMSSILLTGILLLGTSLAHADGGTIMFSGAVVAPTCAAAVSHIQAAANGDVDQRYRCDAPAGTQATTAAHVAEAYQLSVIDTAGTAIGSDRLIVYFANYLSAQPKLVTQTYE